MIILANNYLNDNPLEWLLENSEPSIRYLTRKDILGEQAENAEYSAILESPAIRRMITNNGTLLGDTKNYDLFYKGSVWCFAESVERGLDNRTSLLRNTAEFIISSCQTQSGGFALNWHPRVELACRTGDMIKYLLRAGYRDERIHRGVDWIIKNQRADGGWLHCPLAGICDQLKLVLLKKPGNGLRREQDYDVTSCFFATIACSMALVEFSLLSGPDSCKENICKAAEFFLKRSLYKNSLNEPIASRTSWNRDFRLLGYPVLSQYDVLYGLLFIAKAGYINDRRTGEAFNLIMSKQNNDGTWNMENTQTGMLKDVTMKHNAHSRNKWITMQVLRLLKYSDISGDH